MNFEQKAQKNLAQFLKKLQKSGVLVWSQKLVKQFPGTEVYLVGGAVRDAILGATDNKDYDFVVRGVPMKKLEKFLSRLGWVEKLGRRFGVLKFVPLIRPTCPSGRREGRSYKNKRKIRQNGGSHGVALEPLDIALPRSEFSTSAGGYRDFEVKFNKDLNIEQDLLRRDFTINAIAIEITSPNPSFVRRGITQFVLQQIVDPFKGLVDLQKKIIRCVGKSEARLSEDYTRILRAVRLACQLNFKIESKTKAALKKLAKHLNDQRRDGDGSFIAPREVVAKEFLKALACQPLKTIEFFDELGLFKILMPEVLKMKKCPQPKKFHTEGDVWKHTILALEKLDSSKFKAFEKKLENILEIHPVKSSKAGPPLAEFDGVKKLRNEEIEGDANYVNKDKMELILATFFHDLGKPDTTKTPAKHGVDRIRSDDHDNVGAVLVKKICERLKLSAPADLGVDVERVAWLVARHMTLIHGHPNIWRPTTIEKYFLKDRMLGANLIKLSWLDISATITAQGPLNYNLINALLKRIKEMKSLVKKKNAAALLPAPLLNGHEIMRLLKIKPSWRVGEIKEKLREQQLSGKIKNKQEAKKLVKNWKK